MENAQVLIESIGIVAAGQDMPWSSSETTAAVVKEGEDDLEECVKVIAYCS